MKLAPLPGSLVAAISPPCSSTICCAMLRPRPVPRAFVVTKSWNTSSPSGSPGPVSFTTSSARPSTRPLATSTVPPSGIASIAFCTRLITTCFIFSGSTRTSGAGSPMRSRRSVTPVARASGRSSRVTSSTSASRLVGRYWTRLLRENCRKSPTRLSRRFTSSRMTPTSSLIWAATGAGSGATRRSSTESWSAIELSGFLTSWARPEAKVPTTAIFSLWMMRAWASLSSR